MTMTNPENLKLRQPLYSGCWYSEFQVEQPQSANELRLLRFEGDISSSQRFRAAFRKDLPTLRNIRHGNILSIVDWGEAEGQLFYLTELPEGKPLTELLNNGQFSWDEVTDIGWQIASALQHAHNVGIVHGGLNAACVVVSEQIRVQVTSFGVQRWIEALENVTDKVVLPDPAGDLRQLGAVLELLIRQMSAEEVATQTAPMQQLVDELHTRSQFLIARDVQGRLGNMLLNESGDAIEMVDDRRGQNLSRRSLVDELFDEPAKQPPVFKRRSETAQHQFSRSTTRILLCIVAVAVLTIAIWLAI